ncbi:MAG TPA: HAD family acid phosphatase [Streptosporangiaceae bacterium]|jgi:predicted secreted acid phosphatase
MNRPSTDANDAPPRERRRLSRSWPLIAGSVIAAAGLAFGSLTAASAAAGHGGPPSIAQQAAKVKAEDAFTPRNGNTEMNVTVLEDQIEHYYGSASATFPVVGTVTVPSPSSNYAKQMHQIVSSAESYLGWAVHQHHGQGKPAVVFDIDDTLLNTYDYEIANQFGYTPASNAVFVNAGAFPAVFYMPALVSFASSHGYAVFFITGRPQTQTDATVANLVSAGYAKPADGHLFLKPATPPSYLHCANAPTCTTIEYKSGTRAHIASEGYSIVADFGDQYSDLLGGNAGHQVKIPNPMYYIP